MFTGIHLVWVLHDTFQYEKENKMIMDGIEWIMDTFQKIGDKLEEWIEKAWNWKR